MQSTVGGRSFKPLAVGGPVILPSLLQCDFGNLNSEIRRLEEAGIQGFHLDVMDGHFVPNFTYGMPIVAAVRRATDLPLDVHLMIAHPERYIRQFVEAGADCVTVHAEASRDLPELLESIRRLGVSAGLAINPGTELGAVVEHLNGCDLLLIMSVDAGFGGQAFNPIALDKLRSVRRSHPHLMLEIDGGINPQTIRQSVEAGAQLLVVGSAIFQHQDYRRAVGGLVEAMDR